MRDLSFFNKVYIATKPIDFRKQAHGLAVIVQHSFNLPLTTRKHLFVFTNKRKNAVKLLYWDETGMALWWKGLEKEKSRWPKKDDATWNIDVKELKWLLEGIDLTKIKKHQKLEYS